MCFFQKISLTTIVFKKLRLLHSNVTVYDRKFMWNLMNRPFLPLKMRHCAKANHCIGQFVVDYGNKADHNVLKFFLKEFCHIYEILF